ncbi:ABC transporter ATP-binding protein [Paenibacillus puerhi]|uniref:ABC transporter ATP-binding protein n=1 Tax=Paenibacillus puerhi TaxID=2692622 RepID=UPI0013590456|nr:ABC transporter ATP-binding protein [Paenibacillus puerhi]
MSQAAIEAVALTKDYGNGRGCRDITLRVEQGEAFGFLGPNGAGKSTFVKMLVGLVRPTSGHATLFGQPIGSLEARRLIGYLPELYRYQEWLTGEEVLTLHATLCGLSKEETKRALPELLDEVGIGRRGRDRVKFYSKGMQQRLGLACALVGGPKLVFLDEPSSALDPLGRLDIRELLQRLRQKGITIFLNSHLLEEVETLCDRIALLNDGRILETGAVREVLEGKTTWHFRVGGFTLPVLDWLRELSGIDLRLGLETGRGSEKEIRLELTKGKQVDTNRMSALQSGEVWLEADLEDDEQAGWLNVLLIEQGLTLYETRRSKNRLDEWFVGAVAGLNHRGERA